jgi:hypothetical protein
MFLGLLEVALDHTDALDANALFGGQDFEHFAGLTLMGTSDDDDLVVTFDVEFGGHVIGPPEPGR